MSAKWHVFAFVLLVGLALADESLEAVRAAPPSDSPTSYVYLPFVASSDPCLPIPEEGYQSLSVNPPPTDRPAAQHADLNLALRGYGLTDDHKGLVDYRWWQRSESTAVGRAICCWSPACCQRCLSGV